MMREERAKESIQKYRDTAPYERTLVNVGQSPSSLNNLCAGVVSQLFQLSLMDPALASLVQTRTFIRLEYITKDCVYYSTTTESNSNLVSLSKNKECMY